MAYSNLVALQHLTDVLGVLLLETLVALVISVAVIVDRKVSHLRRWIGIASDFGATAVILHFQGDAVAPLAVLFIWMTIGNGLRFGSAYLLGTALLSTVLFAAVVMTTAYWQAHLSLAAALILAGIVIPARLVSMLRAFKRVTEEARRAGASKSRFLATMSHELRTPLNGIVVTADLLGATPLLREQREYTAVIHSSAHALLGTIQDVLDMAALETGKFHADQRAFSLRRMMQALQSSFRQTAHSKNIAFEIEMAPATPDVLFGDRTHLQRVLANLLDNAFKLTHAGSITLAIAPCATRDRSARLRFEIRHTGIGIPAQAQPSNLSAFEQADIGQGGVGMGATIAKTLTQLMGGEMDFVSRQGEGSMFGVEIPFELATTVPEEEQVVEGNVVMFDTLLVRHRARVPPMRILVADDQPANLLVLTRVLERAGHAFTVVDNGDAALDALSQARYDIALVDLNMPGLTGIELIRRVRVQEAGEGPRTAFVVLSADNDSRMVEACRTAGAMAFVTKPLEIARLLEVIADASRISKSTQAPEPDSRAPLDLDVLNELNRIDGGGGLLRRYAALSISDAKHSLAEAEAAARARAWGEAREACRSLRRAANRLGAQVLVDQITVIDRLPLRRLAKEWHV